MQYPIITGKSNISKVLTALLSVRCNHMCEPATCISMFPIVFILVQCLSTAGVVMAHRIETVRSIFITIIVFMCLTSIAVITLAILKCCRSKTKKEFIELNKFV